MVCYVQAFLVAINQSLEQRFVVGDGLQYVAVVGHIANRPLAQSRTTQSENVTFMERKKTWFKHTTFQAMNKSPCL